MELSVDPIQKTLLRIFCKSVDSTIEYKSIEYCDKTNVQEVIIKLIELLRLENQISDFILCETVGRCMVLSPKGSIKRKIAKNGQSFMFIEQNRRVLLNSDYIFKILTYWKPSHRFSRRLELCYSDTKNQMSSNAVHDYDDIDTGDLSFPLTLKENGSVSTISDTNLCEPVHKSTQTHHPAHYAHPKQESSTGPYLLTLKGDDDTLVIPLSDFTAVGAPGSNANIRLKLLQKYEKQIVCIFSKEKYSQQSNIEDINRILFENVCNATDLCITINGVHTTDKLVLFSGDIINIGDIYSFFFKVSSPVPGDNVKILDYANLSRVGESNSNTPSNDGYSDQSYEAVISNSISSSSGTNIGDKTTLKTLKYSTKMASNNNTMITLEYFDLVLSQLILLYVNDQIQLEYAVALILYITRFCRESPRCCFTIDYMHDQMTKTFCKTLEEAYNNDNYLVANLKLTALGFQAWMVYQTDNSFKSTEENRQWLDYFECFTLESFCHLSDYICERTTNMSLCFFDENPFVNIDKSEKDLNEDNIYTMEKLLEFLNDVYLKINKIDCLKTVEIFKRVLTSRVIIYITESIVTVLLSNMKKFTWNKGIQVSTQLDKFEKWLQEEGQLDIHEADGFLRDFSKLVSTRSDVLKAMDWKQLRYNYKGIHATILRQFLLALVVDDDCTLVQWKPTQNDMWESNQDVCEVLSTYLRSKDQYTLFQPAVVLQNECFAINEVIQSNDFLSILRRLDKELINVGINFQWMDLPKPQSLVNFRNNRLVSPQNSSVREKNSINILVIKKKSIQGKINTSPSFSTPSDKERIITPRPHVMNKYKPINNLNLLSKSLATLDESEMKQKYPVKYRYSSIKNSASNSSISSKNSTRTNKRYPSFTGKDLLSPLTTVKLDIDGSSKTNYSKRSFKESRNISASVDNLNKISKSPLTSPLSQSFQKSASGSGGDDLQNGILTELSSPDACASMKIEVTLTKSAEDSYGITIADGMFTNLKRVGIFIYRVTTDSPAYNSEKIKPGDEILSINNYPVKQLNFAECLMLMKKSLTVLTLSIEKVKFQDELQIIRM